MNTKRYIFITLFMVMMPAAESVSENVTSSSNQAVSDQSTRANSNNDSIKNLEKIVITSVNKNKDELTRIPEKRFKAEDIITSAGAAGDICRYIATLPSVVSSLGENFDNTLYVRGGGPSEVIFLIDGIEMENINHFSKENGSGGPLGFINSEFVKNVDFFAGNAPVQYPSRLSSVVAVDLKNGSFIKPEYSLGCKLTGGTFSIEGPIAGSAASGLIAARYIDFNTLESFVKEWGIPQLGDVYVKGRLLADDNSDLSLTGLLAYNSFTIRYPMVEADNVTASIYRNERVEIERILQGGGGITYSTTSDRITNKTTLAGSFRDGEQYDSLIDFSDAFYTSRYSSNPYKQDTDSRYRLTLTSNADIAVNGLWKLSFGIRGHYQQYRLYTKGARKYGGLFTFCSDTGAYQIIIDEPPQRRVSTMRLYSFEAGGFGEIVLHTEHLSTSLGLRADNYRLLRSTAISPRFSAVYTTAFGTLSFIGGIQHQFPVDIPTLLFYSYSNIPKISDKASTFVNTLLKGIVPRRCYQVSLGYKRTLVAGVQVKSDVYLKWYDHEYHFVSPKLQEVFKVDYTDPDHPQLNLYDQDGKRKAYGFEGIIENSPKSTIHFLLSGSVFDVKNQYRDGEWYDDWTNVGYTASFTLGWNFFNNHLLSVNAAGNGGRPYCKQVIVEDCIGRKSAMYDLKQDYYSERLDKIYSVNIRYGYRREFQHANVELFIEILNVSNTQPTIEYRFNGERFREIKQFGLVPIVGGEISW